MKESCSNYQTNVLNEISAGFLAGSESSVLEQYHRSHLNYSVTSHPPFVVIAAIIPTELLTGKDAIK